ncbi:hypothetical protein CAPTEDRAFT_207748 [Capitella teleta]|uniref:TTF-type domain-containing protein n=1 Tax=Capitella teleta TaxID=283909 RepID=R7VFD4_CAPTE|nr:hypothetical protein CAPTEDRAFT_207748 [Capitella teleta]|eukprot:ELU15016.1 hypothetical protein CAPTEDRAFT_207748 [Capitella teleta]
MDQLKTESCEPMQMPNIMRQARDPRGRIPTDISTNPVDRPTQPKLGKFPKTCCSKKDARKKQMRAFNATWYSSHPWIECSVQKDRAYCFCCRHFGSRQNLKEKSFLEAFSDWKHAFSEKE